VVVGKNWDAVLELVGIWVGCVIDKNHVFEVPVDDAKVFDVHSLWAEIAVFPVEAMMYPLAVWVKIIDNYICIAWVAGSEENDFKESAEIFK